MTRKRGKLFIFAGKETNVMKKCFLILLLAGCFSGNGFSQSFSKKDILLNVGLGINSPYDGGIPLGASLEVGVSDVISAGGAFDWCSYKYGYSNNTYYRYRVSYFGIRGSYHFNQLLKINNDKVDLYAGLTLGYRSFAWRDPFPGTGLKKVYGSEGYLGAHVGVKYYFKEKVGGFLEFGDFGSTNARIGVGFKL